MHSSDEYNFFIYHTYTGYYNSSVPSSANDPTMHSGGQCELGVKMIIIIGEVPLLPNGSLPTQNGSLPNTGGVQPPDTGGVQPSGKTGGIYNCMCMYVCCMYYIPQYS